jgi:hypothetical protein
VQLERERQVKEYHWLNLLCKLLERRLIERLRFRDGRLYTVEVSVFFGLEAPSRQGPVRGDIAVGFSCSPGDGKALAVRRAGRAAYQHSLQLGVPKDCQCFQGWVVCQNVAVIFLKHTVAASECQSR